MNESDHKFIVETETVDAPSVNILLTNTNTSSNNITSNNSNNTLSNTVQNSSSINIQNTNLAKNETEQVQRRDLMNNKSNESDASELCYKKLNGPQTNTTKQVTQLSNLTHTDKSGVQEDNNNNDISAPNNLIDNNPLSLHTSQSVRNKKSVLLLNSQFVVPTANDLNSINDETFVNSLQSKQEPSENLMKVLSVNPSNLEQPSDNYSSSNTINNGKLSKKYISEEHSNVYSTHSSHSDTPVTAASPVQNLEGNNNMVGTGSQGLVNKTSELKSMKIIERPSMPMMNSREILLEDKRPDQPKNKTQLSLKTDETNLMQELSSIQNPTKTDFFAARLASAVGENEVSDSEETFVYESTANSSKNVNIGSSMEPSSEINDHVSSLQGQINGSNKSYGIAPKMSVPLLNTNTKLLNKLKNQRHTSMGALPLGSKLTSSNLANNSSHLGPSFQATSTTVDDIPSVSSINSQHKQHDMQSIKSYSSGLNSPGKRQSLSGIVHNGLCSPNHKSLNPPPIISGKSKKRNGVGSNTPSRTGSISNTGLLQNSVSRHRIPSNLNYNINHSDSKRRLRTTASKIFDANGAPLRRYSGIPDHVNIEDYIEQSNGAPINNNLSKIEQQGDYFDSKRSNNPRENYTHNGNYENHCIIQEEDSDVIDNDMNINQANGQAEKINAPGQKLEGDDDDHSMFYYNHGGDLEARPQISDYDEEDDECSELDNADYDSRLYNTYQYYQDDDNNPKHSKFQDFYTYPHQQHLGIHSYRLPSYSANNTSDVNELTPLRMHQHYFSDEANYSPHNFSARKSSWSRIKHCVYFSFAVVSLVTLGFILGFLLATNKELQGFDIAFIENIISSTDELIFDFTAGAYNPGFFTISVQSADLNIFARSSYTKGLEEGYIKNPSTETVLLGTVRSLESPLQFQGEFFKRHFDVSSSSIKLLNPGTTDAKHDPLDDNDDDGNTSNRLALTISEDDVEKWKRIIKHDYELIMKGSLKYMIPFFNTERTVLVQRNTNVHPGEDNGDPYFSS